MATEKIYVGRGKKKSDTWFKLNLDLAMLIANSYEFNGKKYVKLDINVQAVPDKYGKDVKASIDTYDPNNTQDSKPAASNTPSAVDDLPF